MASNADYATIARRAANAKEMASHIGDALNDWENYRMKQPYREEWDATLRTIINKIEGTK